MNFDFAPQLTKKNCTMVINQIITLPVQKLNVIFTYHFRINLTF